MPSAQRMQVPRDAQTLLVAGVSLALLSSVSWADRLRIGSSPYLLWLPLAFDAAIATIAGAFMLFGSRWFDSREQKSDELDEVPSAPEWRAAKAELDRLRSLFVKDVSDQILGRSIPSAVATPTPDAPSRSTERKGPPAAVTPPVVRNRIEVTSVPAVVLPVEKAQPPQIHDVVRLTDEEVAEMTRLGEILGVKRLPWEERDTFAKRFLETVARGTSPTEPAAESELGADRRKKPRGQVDVEALLKELEQFQEKFTPPDEDPEN